ncbi:MAG TPA: FmdB family zinc ribbon protein [archaeon]|nr:FmdB family zinc ribbon protein [archaeon]
MPTYEYECQTSGKRFDFFQNMSDEPLKACPVCGGPVRRLISPGAGIIFKGSGSHAADSGSKSSSEVPACGNEKPCCGRDVRCYSPPCKE